MAYHIVFNPELISLVGIEIDYRTSVLARRLLSYVAAVVQKKVQIDVLCEDFLEFFDKESTKAKLDIIIMNPPYGAVKVLASDFTDASTRADLSQ